MEDEYAGLRNRILGTGDKACAVGSVSTALRWEVGVVTDREPSDPWKVDVEYPHLYDEGMGERVHREHELMDLIHIPQDCSPQLWEGLGRARMDWVMECVKPGEVLQHMHQDMYHYGPDWSEMQEYEGED